ncbi:UNVERIFIED_CONTAM: tetratricopeptide repeat protein, partial [Bacillus thuringiensis]
RSAIESALQIAPDNRSTILAMANLESLEGTPAKAESRIRMLVSQFPDDVDLLNILAENLESQSKQELACDIYQRIIQINPKSAEAFNDFGAALQKRGESQAASNMFKKAVELDPNLQEARINYGNFLLSEKRYDEALVQ